MSIEKKNVPPPPDENAPVEEVIDYYEKYSPQELIEAGHMAVLPKDDAGSQRRREMAKRALAKKRAQLNIALSENELAELEQYAQAIHIPPSTIAKSWILRALAIEKKRLSETSI